MNKINFYTVAIMSIFVAACSQTNPSESKTVTPTIDKLPAEYVIFEGEKIFDMGDIDGDFKGDAVAFCTKADLRGGFVVYLSKNNQYTYSEFEEFDGWGESMSRKATFQNNAIVMECQGLFVYDKLEVKYDAAANELYFERFECEYSTRDHEVYSTSVCYLSSGQYVGTKEGVELSAHPSRIKIEKSDELFDLMKSY
jgi:hypothetical protein